MKSFKGLCTAFHRRYSLVLLELLIALGLLVVASSIISLQVYRAWEKKSWEVATIRLKEEMRACQQLALAMQADWTLVLEKKRGTLRVYGFSIESGKERRGEWRVPFELVWEGKETKKLAIHFTATGQVLPRGDLVLEGKKSEKLVLLQNR